MLFDGVFNSADILLTFLIIMLVVSGMKLISIIERW